VHWQRLRRDPLFRFLFAFAVWMVVFAGVQGYPIVITAVFGVAFAAAMTMIFGWLDKRATR
jgi:predicted PurR-regulated permease PerM